MSSTPASKSGQKGGRRSRIITLHLSPDKLASFASTTPASSASTTNVDQSPSTNPPDAAEKSESNATPLPTGEAEDQDAADSTVGASKNGDGRKKRGGSNLTGRKRAPPSIDPNAPPRERGRPGPKKKPRLPDGTIDRSHEPTGNKPGIPAHKLGPKANTGAINAGLRALDRSGKPCRRWNKKGVQLKSFTGTVWGMSSWGAPARITAAATPSVDELFAGDVKSDSTASSEVAKRNLESSAVPSERSHSGGDAADTHMANGVESSPVPVAV